MTSIVWAQETSRAHLETVGGKGANLGEMVTLGLPVPPAFIVTAAGFRTLVGESELAPSLSALLDGLDVEDNKALTTAAAKARELIASAPVPKELESELRSAYEQLAGHDGAVAVRSSATAEDLPEASFAGQQDTFLHVVGADEVVRKVLACWASLYTARAVYYRVKQGFDHAQVSMAVVVQRMVDADVAGVLFSRHPSTGREQVIVEAAFGLGEGVVSGQVTPDHYVLDRKGKVLEAQVATKETQVVRGKDGRDTVTEKVPAKLREARVLDDEQLAQLARLASTLEAHYGAPQDVEWAYEDGELYVLQTRPITTIEQRSEDSDGGGEVEGSVLLKGLGASPGAAAGRVAQVLTPEELDRCKEGDVLVTTMTTPDMVPAMRRAAAIVTDEGGMTCHAAIVSRELGIPCVVGTKRATQVLTDGLEVTVYGDRGSVVEGITKLEAKPDPSTRTPAAGAPKPLTATDVKVNISMPEATERAVATEADGVGLLRVEHIILGMGEHPLRLIDGGREEEFIDYLVQNIRRVASAFAPRPVWVRTLDAPTDEFRALPGGENEPREPNPMLGWRGIRRGLEQERLLAAEFKAIRRLREDGLTNIGVMLPLVQHPTEVRRAKAIARSVGLEPDDPSFAFGIMIEIPAAALIVDELMDEGLDFVSFGTNDLTQYTLAVDRNNEHVAPLFSEFHPAIAKLIRMVILAARERGVETSICGQAGSDPKFVAKLIEWGISSVSANIDAVARVRETVARVEQRILLDQARRGGAA